MPSLRTGPIERPTTTRLRALRSYGVQARSSIRGLWSFSCRFRLKIGPRSGKGCPLAPIGRKSSTARREMSFQYTRCRARPPMPACFCATPMPGPGCRLPVRATTRHLPSAFPWNRRSLLSGSECGRDPSGAGSSLWAGSESTPTNAGTSWSGVRILPASRGNKSNPDRPRGPGNCDDG